MPDNQAISRRRLLRNAAPGHSRWRRASTIYLGSGSQSRPTSSSSWPTISAMPTCRATGGPISARRTSIAWPQGRALPAGLRQLRGLFGNAHRADHRPLPVPAAARAWRSRWPATRCRPAAGPSHLAVAVEEGRLRHDACRQVASGRAAEIRPAAERLRPFLRIPRRRASTTTSTPHRIRRTISGTTTCRSHQMGYLTGSARQPCRGCRQWLCEIRPAVSDQPAFQRAALAVGSAGRRGGVEPLALRQESVRFRRRHAEDLSAHDPGNGSCRSAAFWRRWMRMAWRRTRSSFSPATTAANDSPIPGRSPAGRRNCWKADCGYRPSISLAGAHSAGPNDRSSGDQHGLAADAAGGRGRSTRSGIPARRHQPAADAHAECGAQSSASCSGATRRMRSERRETATSSI